MHFPRNVTVTVEIVPVSKDVGGESEGDADAVQLLVRSSGSTGAALFVVAHHTCTGSVFRKRILVEERTSREACLIFVMGNAFKRCGGTAAVYTTCRAHGTIQLLALHVELTN